MSRHNERAILASKRACKSALQECLSTPQGESASMTTIMRTFFSWKDFRSCSKCQNCSRQYSQPQMSIQTLSCSKHMLLLPLDVILIIFVLFYNLDTTRRFTNICLLADSQFHKIRQSPKSLNVINWIWLNRSGKFGFANLWVQFTECGCKWTNLT